LRDAALLALARNTGFESEAVDCADDQVFAADLRSILRCDIAAIAPIRSIKMYIFKVSPGISPPDFAQPSFAVTSCNKRNELMKGNLRQSRGRLKTQHVTRHGVAPRLGFAGRAMALK
jgi:hypothetical protein